MNGFQRIVAGGCLGALLPLGLAAPTMAATEAASPPRTPAARQHQLTSTPLDLRLLVRDDLGGGLAMALPRAAGSISLQTSGGGWSGLSTAKKTWIIVGIVVGAAAIVAVVSNHGDDNQDGGGY